MIYEIVDKMFVLITDLEASIELDIEDIKQAKHESLLNRNDQKHYMIEEITNLKQELNQELISKMQQGEDIDKYRDKVNSLEAELLKLYESNKRLASLVLPVQQMYKDLVEEITNANGGQIFDIKA
ncbi:MAG: hypothetical protein ACERKK_05080 [Poseidonibacter sp.]|uniref:hypothetical protein n=1 Tax=Poseidonibacter sp. TaxID=2321188 RepID=UPI00359D7CCD